MLILTRRISQRIRIGPDIVITLVRSSKDMASIGIDAPADTTILREELCDDDDRRQEAHLE